MLKTFPAILSVLQGILLLFLASLFFGCAATKEAERKLAEISLQNRVLEEKNRQLANELSEQKNTAARLQMELVEKQVEINKAKAAQTNIPPQDPEPLQDRMPPPNSKAEAVTCLAEVETEINAAREAAATDKEPQDFSQIDDLLKRSRVALTREQYDEACTQAYQALTMTRETRLKAVLPNKGTTSVYADFLEPMQLRTVKRCNMRSRASNRSKVLEILAADTDVTAIGYRGNWIKITSSTQAGWVYYTLLTVPLPTVNSSKRP